MRRDAQRDLVFELLDHVPVGDGLKLFKEKGVLTTTNAAKVEAGYEALKGLINDGRGLTAKDNPEQFQKIMEGNFELTKAIQMIPREALTTEQKKWLDSVGRVYKVSVSALAAEGHC